MSFEPECDYCPRKAEKYFKSKFRDEKDQKYVATCSNHAHSENSPEVSFDEYVTGLVHES